MNTNHKKLFNVLDQVIGFIHFLMIILAIYPCRYSIPIDYLCQALITGICQK